MKRKNDVKKRVIIILSIYLLMDIMSGFLVFLTRKSPVLIVTTIFVAAMALFFACALLKNVITQNNAHKYIGTFGLCNSVLSIIQCVSIFDLTTVKRVIAFVILCLVVLGLVAGFVFLKRARFSKRFISKITNIKLITALSVVMLVLVGRLLGADKISLMLVLIAFSFCGAVFVIPLIKGQTESQSNASMIDPD